MPRRSGVSIRTTQYQKFKGADFSTEPALVDRARSPLCTNMISDAGGMPEKRCGWETLHRLMNGDTPVRINGLHAAKFGAQTVFYCHAGTKLYTWDTTDAAPVEKLTGLYDGKSRSASLAGKLWIITGGELIACDGTTVNRAAGDGAYIPTTVITRDPSGGGTPYENVNLINRYRKNSFQTDGSAVTFRVDADSIDSTGDVRCWVWGEEVTDFTVDREAGEVTFTTAPAAPEAGSADGLVIQFPATVEGYADMINRCTILTTYGAGSSDRLILSGNPDYPNRDWTSGLNDPTYFPDLGYATVGIDNVAIKGYCRIGSALAIIKEDNGQDSTVFFRTAEVNSEGTVVFRLAQTMTGVGAVSPGGFATLLDEPLFVSGTGIYAATTNALTGDRVGQNRSYYLNAKLTTEDLTDCEAAAWKGMYLLSIGNGNVYVLDGRQNKTYRSESLGDFVYEGYYWEGMPARCWLNWEHGGEETMFFGTADGRICRIKTDRNTLDRFNDDGLPIVAVWATKMDDDGDPTVLKTMLKRGCAVTIKPYTRSSAKVYFRTDREPVEYRTGATMDIFSWEDLDFNRFTFNANDAPQEIFFNTKVKKYKRLQILIRNDSADEGFGVFGITKHFVLGNFAKR